MIAGRVKFCGMEDRTVIAYGCRKANKIMWGMEGENIVAYDRQPSPACTGH